MGVVKNKLDKIKEGTLKSEKNRKLESEINIFFEILKFHQFEAITEQRFTSYFIFNLLLIWIKNPNEVYCVIDEIKHLEDSKVAKSFTKREAKLKGVLSNLWHKHYFVPDLNCIINNIHTELNREDFIRERSKRVFKKIQSDSHIYRSQKISKIVYAFTEELFFNRQRNFKVTGEWIIYIKFENKNYYLSLETHNKKMGDEMLLGYLNDSINLEFPFLKI